MPYLGSSRRLVPSVQVSDLTKGSITLPSGGGAIADDSLEIISTLTSTGSTSSFVFSSIPQTFESLIIRGTVKSNRAANATDGFQMTFNSIASGYYEQILENNNSTSVTSVYRSAQSYAYVGYYILASTSAPNSYTGLIMDIFDYANTNKNTSWLVLRGNGGYNSGTASGNANSGTQAGFVTDTSAITSITLQSTTSSTFAAGSTFTLYGVKNS